MSTPGIPGGTAGGSSEPPELQPGLSYEFSERVEHSLTVQSHDPAMPAVYATPAMVLAMERAAGRTVEAALPPGTLTLGTAIHVEHLAATPEGMQVTVRAELIRVDGRFLWNSAWKRAMSAN